MRALIDYRAALRQRTGVGEYTHELVRALAALPARPGADGPLELTVFSSSWKDRLERLQGLAGVAIVDRRIPVRLLNFAWHRLGWPAAETLARGAFDVVHSLHPLLMPARSAARVVTIYDLHFLDHPERTRAEIRRDYPRLAGAHARRADRVITISEYTACETARRLGVPRERIDICTPGAPPWAPRAAAPERGYVLFFGTLEPRKNVGALLDAYERLLRGPHGRRSVPDLVIAGRATAEARPWLERIRRPPLNAVARHVGYVTPADRRALYEGARLLVQPSFDEGFGITVLEAMTIGVPVVAARRGALPEVLGDAGPLVDPERPDAIADAIARMLDDREYAEACAVRGVARSRAFSWTETARRVCQSYRQAIEHRRCASA